MNKNVGLLMIAAALGVAPAGAGDDGATERIVTVIAENGTYGCRRPFGHGVYDEESGATTVCWNGEGMSVYVRRYDHRRGTWGASRRVCKNDWTGRWDYHNYPTMVMAPDGHLLIFFFAHSRTPYMLRSAKPRSVEGSWSKSVLPRDRNAYPMPIVCGDTVYLFYSRSDNIGQAYRTCRYVKSSDNGRTWSRPRMAIDSQQKVPGRFDEVYAIGYHLERRRGKTPARVGLTWEMHGGPGHNKGTRNNYFVYFLPESQTFRSVDGTDLGDWIDYDQMERKCTVDRATERTSHPFGYATVSTALSDGTPLVLYRYYRETRLVRWNGKAWERLDATPPVVGDMTTADDGTVQVLGARGREELVLAESSDGGATWRTAWSGRFPHANGSDAIRRPGFIANAHPDMPGMTSAVDSEQRYTNYRGLWPVVVVQARGASKRAE